MKRFISMTSPDLWFWQFSDKDFIRAIAGGCEIFTKANELMPKKWTGQEQSPSRFGLPFS
ncbi:hypothetical protein [Pseudogemmobacter sonorensis]|uniref:hypothetical protein n=1 Tax=Pseudogemmobacter sonorensis TaxID=2989681 RepID=UPI0036ABDEBC